jgi:hypothetical protein
MEWYYSSTHEMEVSYQLHAPAALPLAKELSVTIGQEAR